MLRYGNFVQSLSRHENLATKEIFLVPGATIRRLIILRAGEVDDKTVKANLRAKLEGKFEGYLEGKLLGKLEGNLEGKS